MQSETGLDKVSNFFEDHGDTVLTFNLNVNGRIQEVHFLREIVLDDDGLVDHQKLLQRMERLPGMVAFYGVLKDRAAEEVAAEQESFDIWYAEKSALVNERKIAELADTKMAASLKKAPTQADLKGFIMLEFKPEWEARMTALRTLKQKQSIMNNVFAGIVKATDIVQSKSKLLGMLWDKGVEEIRIKLPNPRT